MLTLYGESPLSHQTRLCWALMGALFGAGGISLLHVSWGHPRRALPVILALWSPDFPHPKPVGASAATVRPGRENIVLQEIQLVKHLAKSFIYVYTKHKA